MKWSWRIGRIAGIGIDVHATFAFLLAWVAVAEYQRTQSLAGMIDGLIFILAVFASVIAHEYGHALTARRYGVRTRNILILPIGGVASLERIPSDPRQELAIAVAGPMVTLGLVALFYLILRAIGAPMIPPTPDDFFALPFLARLMWINLYLAAFNVLPAFPMDGGRMLRAGLAMRFEYVQATRIAAHVGRAFALLFGIVGLAYNPFLVLIAVFVWIGATGESWNVQLQSALRGLPVSSVMIRDLRVVHPHDTLSRAVDHLLAGFQQDFPVVDGQGVVGVLTRTDLVKALAQHGSDAPVHVAMRSDFQVAHPAEPLEEAFSRLQGSTVRTMPVVLNGTLLGVLTLDNVGEFFMVHGATRSNR
ncbi:MAG TPA: site-2 protease family protein [Gemmatimonadaceae bacterium]